MDTVCVNYRTPLDLGDFLESYRRHPPAEGRLWVCNVDPLPADRDVACDYKGELGLKELVFEENVGYARACNAAAALGSSDVVAIFNADVVLSEGALDRCADALLAEPSWGVLGPRQTDLSGRMTAGGIFGSSARPTMRGWQAPDGPQFADVRDDAVSVSGAALWARRTVWDALAACPDYRAAAPTAEGALLPTRHYYEETYFAYHARHHGWRCVYFGEVQITHKWHRASPLGSSIDRDVMAESRRLFREACARHGMECD